MPPASNAARYWSTIFAASSVLKTNSPSLFMMSMPACLMREPSSLVVRTMSTSWTPLSFISGRAASNFLAVHGMMETTTMSSGFTPIFSA